jgi:hypothetical protein
MRPFHCICWATLFLLQLNQRTRTVHGNYVIDSTNDVVGEAITGVDNDHSWKQAVAQVNVPPGPLHLNPFNDDGFTHSRVSVHIPADLHVPDGFAHIIARYGTTARKRRGSLSLFTYYFDVDLCEGIPGHDAWENHLYPPVTAKDPMKHSFALMMKRGGGCTTVTKARVAQHIGATAAIIADTTCHCDDDACMAQYKNTTCEKLTPLMTDDGSAEDISIPVFMLARMPSEAIKDQLSVKNQSVLIELTWGLEDYFVSENDIHKRGISNRTVDQQKYHHPIPVHLWLSARETLLSYDDYHDLRVVVESLQKPISTSSGPAIVFSPHHVLFAGDTFKCSLQKNTTDGPCDHLCTNFGRYCHLHHYDLSGHAIVRETLRRTCIWSLYGTNTTADDDEYHDLTNGTKSKPDNEHGTQLSGKEWWDYTLYHHDHCHGAHLYSDESCVTAALLHAGVNKAKIDDCMGTSHPKPGTGLDDDAGNDLLNGLLLEANRNGIITTPSITVNHLPLRAGDEVSAKTLFTTICDWYFRSNAPHVPVVCEKCMSCANVVGCLTSGNKCPAFYSDSDRHPAQPDAEQNPKNESHKKEGGGYHFGRIFFFLLMFGGIGYAAWYYYKQQGGEFSFSGSSMFGNRGGREGLIRNEYFQLNQS